MEETGGNGSKGEQDVIVRRSLEASGAFGQAGISKKKNGLWQDS